eukprot:TRINITY_DN23421_c0_g1_i1.p1 TRINITY_DN23421_c0_g1~~TRINITY_DN23421_c0_g1_i1.p1  ORF type:complete len:1289 (+),score=278.83 TRINITY_DN23421_c0_g1_i1:190-4056(+)
MIGRWILSYFNDDAADNCLVFAFVLWKATSAPVREKIFLRPKLETALQREAGVRVELAEMNALVTQEKRALQQHCRDADVELLEQAKAVARTEELEHQIEILKDELAHYSSLDVANLMMELNKERAAKLELQEEFRKLQDALCESARYGELVVRRQQELEQENFDLKEKIAELDELISEKMHSHHATQNEDNVAHWNDDVDRETNQDKELEKLAGVLRMNEILMHDNEELLQQLNATEGRRHGRRNDRQASLHSEHTAWVHRRSNSDNHQVRCGHQMEYRRESLDHDAHYHQVSHDHDADALYLPLTEGDFDGDVASSDASQPSGVEVQHSLEFDESIIETLQEQMEAFREESLQLADEVAEATLSSCALLEQVGSFEESLEQASLQIEGHQQDKALLREQNLCLQEEMQVQLSQEASEKVGSKARDPLRAGVCGVMKLAAESKQDERDAEHETLLFRLKQREAALTESAFVGQELLTENAEWKSEVSEFKQEASALKKMLHEADETHWQVEEAHKKMSEQAVLVEAETHSMAVFEEQRIIAAAREELLQKTRLEVEDAEMKARVKERQEMAEEFHRESDVAHHQVEEACEKAENWRHQAEDARNQADAATHLAENACREAEHERDNMEDELHEAESARHQAEGAHHEADDARHLAEDLARQNEGLRRNEAALHHEITTLSRRCQQSELDAEECRKRSAALSQQLLRGEEMVSFERADEEFKPKSDKLLGEDRSIHRKLADELAAAVQAREFAVCAEQGEAQRCTVLFMELEEHEKTREWALLTCEQEAQQCAALLAQAQVEEQDRDLVRRARAKDAQQRAALTSALLSEREACCSLRAAYEEKAAGNNELTVELQEEIRNNALHQESFHGEPEEPLTVCRDDLSAELAESRRQLAERTAATERRLFLARCRVAGRLWELNGPSRLQQMAFEAWRRIPHSHRAKTRGNEEAPSADPSGELPRTVSTVAANGGEHGAQSVFDEVLAAKYEERLLAMAKCEYSVSDTTRRKAEAEAVLVQERDAEREKVYELRLEVRQLLDAANAARTEVDAHEDEMQAEMERAWIAGEELERCKSAKMYTDLQQRNEYVCIELKRECSLWEESCQRLQDEVAVLEFTNHEARQAHVVERQRVEEQAASVEAELWSCVEGGLDRVHQLQQSNDRLQRQINVAITAADEARRGDIMRATAEQHRLVGERRNFQRTMEEFRKGSRTLSSPLEIKACLARCESCRSEPAEKAAQIWRPEVDQGRRSKQAMKAQFKRTTSPGSETRRSTDVAARLKSLIAELSS